MKEGQHVRELAKATGDSGIAVGSGPETVVSEAKPRAVCSYAEAAQGMTQEVKDSLAQQVRQCSAAEEQGKYDSEVDGYAAWKDTALDTARSFYTGKWYFSDDPDSGGDYAYVWYEESWEDW